MPTLDAAADDARPDESPQGDFAEAGLYRTSQEGFDHCLVVLALGHDCWLVPTESGCRLQVAAAAVEQVRAELARYDRESRQWPPVVAPSTPARARLELGTPMLWAFAVLLVARGQLLHPAWTDAGALDATAVYARGEWWRAVTALFLHADGAHLISNLIAGVFIFGVALATFGRARGWLLLGLAAVTGNLAVAAAHYPEPYRSLGASTAIFAALGLLTGRAVRIAISTRRPHRWRAAFLPFATGLTFLALYGAGGPPVDVLAHVSGFVTGTLLGFGAGRPLPARAD